MVYGYSAKNLFTVKDFIFANETLLEHDIKTKNDDQLFIIARAYWLSFVRANNWSDPLMTSAQKRSEYVSCMHYMIKALARVGLEARKQGISLKKLAEKYLLVNWTKATKRWCAMFVLMSDSQIDLERYIYGVICNKVNIVMTMSDKVAFELVHSFVESFWTASERCNFEQSLYLKKYTTKPIIDA